MSENAITLFLIIIYIYCFLVMRYARTPKPRQCKALGRIPNAYHAYHRREK